MDRVTFRGVTMDDYELVLQIRIPDEIYNGFDYLPFEYKGYVAEIGGEVVS